MPTHAEIKARLSKITPGEWQAVNGDSYCAYPVVMVKAKERALVIHDCSEDAPEDYPGMNDDAQFIANAPADLAWLLAEHDRLRDALEKIHVISDRGSRWDGIATRVLVRAIARQGLSEPLTPEQLALASSSPGTGVVKAETERP